MRFLINRFTTFLFLLLPFLSIMSDDSIPPQEKSQKEQVEWTRKKRVALIIGVEQYKDNSLQSLKHAVEDSIKFKSAIEHSYDEIILLNDSQAKKDSSLLPTKNNILTKLDELLKIKPGVIVIYFSGHGFEFNNENHIAPSDAVVKLDPFKKKNEQGEVENKLKISDVENALSLTKINDKIRKYGVDQTMFFIDACRENLGKGSRSAVRPTLTIPKDILNSRGTVIMMATQPGGYSYEEPSIGGVFTHYLVKGLTGGVQNLGPEYVTIKDLDNYVKKKLQEYTGEKKKEDENASEQVPYLKGDINGDPLVSVGRPIRQGRVEFLNYWNLADDRVQSKSFYGPDGFRRSTQFFTLTEGKEFNAKDLDGVGRLVYEYKKDISFAANEHKLEGEMVFSHGLEYKENKGWIFKSFAVKNNEELAGSDVKYMQQVFDFNGNLIEKKYWDKNGTEIADNQDIYRRVYAFNVDRKKTLEEYYDNNNRLTDDKHGIARYIAAYDSKKNKILEETYDKDGNPVAGKGSSIARTFYRYRIDPQRKKDAEKPRYISRLVKKEYRDENGNLTAGNHGVARIRIQYTKDGRLKQVEYFGKDKKPENFYLYLEDIDNNGAKTKTKFIAYDNNETVINRFVTEIRDKPLAWIEQKVDGEKEKKKTNWPGLKMLTFPVAKIVYKYDKEIKGKKYLTEIAYYKKDDSLTAFRIGGIAKTRIAYDPFANPIKIAYYGESDKPVTNTERIHAYIKQYHEKCYERAMKAKKNGETCIKLQQNLNAANKPTADNTGIAITKRNFGKHGHFVFPEYYNTKNEIIEKEFNGIFWQVEGKKDKFNVKAAKVIVQYNETCLQKTAHKKPESCMELLTYQKKDGSNMANENGIYGYHQKFNKEGKAIEVYFTGKDNKIINHKAFGWAKKVDTYQDKRLTSVIHYDAAGKQVGEAVHHSYDAKTGVLKSWFTDKDNNKIGYKRLIGSKPEISKQRNHDFKPLEEIFSLEKKLNKDGKLLEIKYLNKDGKIVNFYDSYKGYYLFAGIFQFEYDEDGLMVSEKNILEDGRVVFWKKEGYWQRAYFNEKAEPMVHDGHHKVIQNLDEKTPIEENYFDINNKLSNRKSYEEGHLVQDAYYTADGKLKLDKNGIAIIFKEYSGDRVIAESYLKKWYGHAKEEKKQLLNNKDGVAKIVYKYRGEDFNKLNEIHFYDDKEQPAKKLAKVKIYYDNKSGKETARIHYNAENKIIKNTGTKITYEKGGNVISREFFDNKPGEVRKLIYSYDNAGNLLSEEARDDKNNLMLMRGQVARIQYKYSDKKHIQEVRYLNQTGQLQQNWNGISKVLYKTDDRGNITKETYCGKADKEKCNILYSMNYGYDNHGNKNFESKNGADEKPIAIIGNIYSVRYNFDKTGNLLQKSFYGAKNQLVAEPSGVAIYLYSYDDKGRRISEAYYDNKGHLKENEFGIARYEVGYNNKGERIYTASYTGEDIPIERKKYYGKENEKLLISYEKTNLEKVGRTIEGKEEKKYRFLDLKSRKNFLFFKNPRGSEDKRLIKLTLDKYYRPTKIDFMEDLTAE